MGVLVFFAITAAAALMGVQILRWTGLKPGRTWSAALSGTGLGMVIVGYAILIYGLISHLTIIPFAATLAVMVAVGLLSWRIIPACWYSAVSYIREVWRHGPGYRAVLVFLAFWVVLSLVGALIPPGSADYDGLSQHLAQAWTYAHEQAVFPLWFDHHSQFPATMQMLFTGGMLADGYVTARLLNCLTGLMCIIWVVLIANRFVRTEESTLPGLWAALVVVTMPIFAYLTGVTYVDLAVASFGLGGLYFFLAWYHERQSSALLLMGLMLGGGMTVKMQILALAGLLIVASAIVAIRRSRGRQLAVAVGLMLVVGSPWYIKTYLITGNPVYPFAYEIFGGKQWSQQQADAYERHQMEFGVGELPSPAQMRQMPGYVQRFIGPRAPHRWLMGPVLLTLYPWEFSVGSGPAQSYLTEWIGPLVLPLALLLLFLPRPPSARTILWLMLPLWLWWFYSMQYTRYLLPTLLLLCPVLGYSLSRLLSHRGLVRASAAALTGAWSLIALVPLLLNVSIAMPVLTGQMSWQTYLTHTLDVYEPSRYIAEYLPTDAKIATYGEPRYYYFRRPAIWADPGHSRLLEYQGMAGPEELIDRYRQLGVTHVLINRMHTGGGPGEANSPPMRLIHQAIQDGLLRQVTVFPRRTQYLLLRVTDRSGAVE